MFSRGAAGWVEMLRGSSLRALRKTACWKGGKTVAAMRLGVGGLGGIVPGGGRTAHP